MLVHFRLYHRLPSVWGCLRKQDTVFMTGPTVQVPLHMCMHALGDSGIYTLSVHVNSLRYVSVTPKHHPGWEDSLEPFHLAITVMPCSPHGTQVTLTMTFPDLS